MGDLEKILERVLHNDSGLQELTLLSDTIMDRQAKILGKALKKNTLIHSLKMMGVTLSKEGLKLFFEALKKNHALQSLGLWLCRSLSDSDLDTLAEVLQLNTTLHVIDLRINNLSDISALAKALAINTGLHSFILHQNNISDPGARELACALKINQTLLSLDLTKNTISSLGATDLSDMLSLNHSLVALYLAHNEINDVGAKAIATSLRTNTSLRELSLDYNRISHEGAHSIFKAVKINTSLTTLGLAGCRISNATIKPLAAALENDSPLTLLGMHNNYISNSGAVRLAKALEKNKILQELRLGVNLIGSHGGIELAKALAKNSSLKILDLEENKIDSAGANAFAEALITNTCLQKLRLADNNIDNLGTQALAQALQKNSSLQVLGLSSNMMSDIGAQHLAEALKKNNALQHLDLSNNRIGDVGAQSLADALRKNDSLLVLEISKDNMSEAGARSLIESLKTNTSLQFLELYNNKISSRNLNILLEMLSVNYTITSLGFFYDDLDDSRVSNPERYKNLKKAMKNLKRNRDLKLHLDVIEAYLSQHTIDGATVQQACLAVKQAIGESQIILDNSHYLVESHRLLTALHELSQGKSEARSYLFSRFTHTKLQEVAHRALLELPIVIFSRDHTLNLDILCSSQTALEEILASKRIHLAKDPYLHDSYHLLNGLKYLSEGKAHEALGDLLQLFSHPRLRETAHLALGRCLFDARWLIIHLPKTQTIWWWQLLIYSLSGHLHMPESVEQVYTAIAALHREKTTELDTISVSRLKNDVFLTTYHNVLASVSEALVNRHDEESINTHEIALLTFIRQQKPYSPLVIPYLLKCPMFLRVLKKQSGDKKEMILLEDYLLPAETPIKNKSYRLPEDVLIAVKEKTLLQCQAKLKTRPISIEEHMNVLKNEITKVWTKKKWEVQKINPSVPLSPVSYPYSGIGTGLSELSLFQGAPFKKIMSDEEFFAEKGHKTSCCTIS